MSVSTRFQFALGPVQGWIAQARSVRDLWTGSYLISWLTARAAAEALNRGATFDDPQWEASPLVKLHRAESTQTADAEALRRSALPNTFRCSATGDPAPLAEALRQSVQTEWERIAGDVHHALGKHLAGQKGWDAQWHEQIRGFWSISVDYLNEAEATVDAAVALGAPQNGLSADTQILADELLGRAAAATKMLRQPRPHGDAKDPRPKCTITSEHAQMGPVSDSFNLSDHALWWKPENPMAKAVAACGERLRGSERLGAPALVKRLAWAVSLSPRVAQSPGELRTTDTATIAAAPWIASLRALAEPIPSSHDYLHDWAREKHHGWSGQWLHREDDEEPMPHAVAMMLADARKLVGPPPTYLAALMMDGDKMGERLRHCSAAQRRDFTIKLSAFAGTEVPALVQTYLGGNDGFHFNQPIYAGGDDVLALLPLRIGVETAIGLAGQITQAFANLKLPGSGDPATMSAGLAVVHYKTDLREALDMARAAEKAAKESGRNRLTLTAARRSGEHASATLLWGEQVKVFDALVKAFSGDASDRWAYRLRGVLDELDSNQEECSFVNLLDAECARLLHHADLEQDHRALFSGAWDLFTQRKPDATRTIALQRNAITLIQSASFIARGREEGR